MHSNHFLISSSGISRVSSKQSIIWRLTLLIHYAQFLKNRLKLLQSTECLLNNHHLNLQSMERLLSNQSVNHSPCFHINLRGALQSTERLLSNQSVNHSPCWCTLRISSQTCLEPYSQQSVFWAINQLTIHLADAFQPFPYKLAGNLKVYRVSSWQSI